MDIDSYLDRINYRGSRVPTSQTLRDLQVAHLMSVPFENLSIHTKEPIVLTTDWLFKKIVQHRRGGFCYELNGLFAELLRDLGFEVEMLAAEVARPDGSFGRKFDHMTLKVRLEDDWLVDVGFGESFVEPLLLDERETQAQGENTFRIAVDGESYLLERRLTDEQWKTQYRFDLQPHELVEYEEMCLYHQTSPESHFTQNRICSRATTSGRITLSGMQLITTERGVRKEKLLDGAEYARALRDYFGVSEVR